MLRLVALVILAGTLSGCGLKGNLYLPEKSPVVTSAPAQSVSSSSDSSSSSSATSLP